MSDKQVHLSSSLRASFLVFPILSGYSQVALLPILPNITEHFAGMPNSGAWSRFLVTSVGIAMILGAPLAAILANRFGWRTTLIGAVLIFSLGGAAGSLLDSLWMIAVTRIFVGLSAAILGALLMAILTLQLDARQRDRWIGYVVVSGTLAALALIPLSGFLGGISWRLPFAFHLAGLLALFAIIPGVKEPETAFEQPGRKVATNRAFPFWAVGLGLIIGVLVQAQNTFVPFHLADIGMNDPREISMALVLSVPIIALMSLMYGTLRRYLTMKAIFIVASIACAAGSLTSGLGNTYAIVVGGNIIVGLGSGLLSPNMYAYAASRSDPEHRARDLGVLRGLFSAGPFIGQIALEPVAAFGGAGSAVAGIGLIGICAALGFGMILRGGTRARPAKVAI